MKYKTKLAVLLPLIAVCVLVLIADTFFDPQNMNARTSLYTWLDRTWINQADQIVIKGTGLASDSVMLIRKSDRWFVLADGVEYPTKQEQVTDLFNLLSVRASYPVRSTSQSSHERLGVTEQAASRIIVYGGVSQIPLLDLLIGSGNSTGNEIYLRKNGSNEVRSGADYFTHFSDAKRNAWFDLRLFLFNNDKTLTNEMVQRVSIYKNSAGQNVSYTLSRYAEANGTSWIIDSPSNTIIDNTKAESFVRTLLTSEAADFAGSHLLTNTRLTNWDFSFGKVELLLEDLSVVSIMFGPELENNQHPAIISGKPFVHLIPQWTVERILRDAEYFSE